VPEALPSGGGEDGVEHGMGRRGGGEPSRGRRGLLGTPCGHPLARRHRSRVEQTPTGRMDGRAARYERLFNCDETGFSPSGGSRPALSPGRWPADAAISASPSTKTPKTRPDCPSTHGSRSGRCLQIFLSCPANLL